MSAPAVAPWTQLLWDRLPQLYRAADEAQADGPDGFPLLRWLSLICDQAGEVEALFDRISLHLSEGETVWLSDLADPDRADDGWLTWIAQLIGIQVDLGSSLAESYAQLVIDYPTYGDLLLDNVNYAQVRQHGSEVGAGIGPDQLRQAIRDAALGRLAASTGAYDRLIAPYLVGQQRVLHQRIFGGDPWALQLETYAHETPNPVVVGAVISRTPHVAGLKVTYATRVGGSYQDLVDHFATYADLVTMFPTYSALAGYIP